MAAASKSKRALQAPTPPFRRLRVYAFDPSVATKIDTVGINEATLKIPWESGGGSGNGATGLAPGPVGEYLEVIDYDPATGVFYEPVDLDDPTLLAQEGLDPSEGNPKFHQQMVYAVAMTTIGNFEQALGRKALWAERDYREFRKPPRYEQQYVQRLRIYPHALREANAYYSPQKKALLFGYFPASSDDAINLPGGTIFTCLSHDIVAHETTHALLDGLHPKYIEPSNPDSQAFHEAFADIVALFQHFSFPEALRHQAAQTRGDLAGQNLLGELAQQFGQAIGTHGALRSAIGGPDPETKQWKPAVPDRGDYERFTEPHNRGAILVAAVFDAFLTIYKSRVRDLLRIASNGTGVLQPGELHPDLVNRLCDQAAKSARHVLRMCIRALDYCPPVDITFGEYLRALITADADLVPDDALSYRVAVVDAFRKRGIYPRDVRSLAVDSLRWQTPDIKLPNVDRLRDLWTGWNLKSARRDVYLHSKENQKGVHKWLQHAGITRKVAYQTGLALGASAPMTINRSRDGSPAVSVNSFRPARRIGPDGDVRMDLVVEFTQSRAGFIDPDVQRKQDRKRTKADRDFAFRGGCTMLIDLESGVVRYCIGKHVLSDMRLERQRSFFGPPEDQGLRATYFGDFRTGADREPFALLHRGI